MSENLSLITDYKQLKEFIVFEGTGEPRNTEFKKGNDWKYMKYKVTKAILGLSNLEYGGKVILGIEENTENLNFFVGMTQVQSETYTLDNVKEFVNEYADPQLEIKLHKMDARKLQYHTRDRFDFGSAYTYHTNTIKLETLSVSFKELQIQHDELAGKKILEIFDYFGCDPIPIHSIIKQEQKKFYSHSF